MGIIGRQSIKTTAVVYLGVVFGLVNYLLIIPKIFTIEQIGIIRLFQDLSVTLSVIGILSSSVTSIKLYPYFKSKGDSAKFNGSILLYSLIGVSSLLLIIWVKPDIIFHLLGKSYSNFSEYVSALIIAVLAQSLFNVFESFSKNAQRIVVPTFIREILLRAFLLGGFIAFELKFIDFDNFIVVYCIIYVINTFILSLYYGFLSNFNLSIDIKFFRNSFNKIFKESMIFYANSISVNLSDKIDIFMIGYMLGAKGVGYFTIPYLIGSIIDIPQRILRIMTSPFISQYWQENRINEIESFAKKSISLLTLIGTVILIVVVCNVNVVLSIIPNSSDFRNFSLIVSLVAFSRLIQMMSGITANVIIFSSKNYFNIYFTIFSLVINIVLNIVFIPLYGVVGAAIATVILNFILNTIKIMFTHKILNVKYMDKNIVYSYLVTTFFIIISFFIGILENYIVTLSSSLALVTLYCLLVYKLKFSQQINDLLNEFIKTGKIRLF